MSDAIDAKRVTPDCSEGRHDGCNGWCYCDCHDVLVEAPDEYMNRQYPIVEGARRFKWVKGRLVPTDPADVPWGRIAQEGPGE